MQTAQPGARVDEDHCRRQHAELADPIKRAHWQPGQPHHKVHHEKRDNGHKSQREQIKRALALDAFVDCSQSLAIALLHGVAQDETTRKKSQRRANAGSKRYQHGAFKQAKHCARRQGQQGRCRQRQCRNRHIDHEEPAGKQKRIGLPIGIKIVLPCLQRLQTELVLQPEREKRGDRGKHCNDDEKPNLPRTVFHGCNGQSDVG